MKTKMLFRRMFLHALYLSWVGVFAAPCQTTAPASSKEFADEVDAYRPPERVNHHDPSLALGALIDSREIFVQQRSLYETEIEYEKALANGEHPNAPTNYTSSGSRLELVKSAALSLNHCVQGIRKILALPENASIEPQVREKIEATIAGLPSTDKYVK